MANKEWTPDIVIDNWTPEILTIGSFKPGGRIAKALDAPETEETEQKSVIPEGSLHKDKHHMENTEGMTKKGIPVVDDDSKQQAEIERNEIIFTKEVTKKLEELYKVYYDDDSSAKEKDEAAIDAGKLLTKEIMLNTDDRTGLIDTLKKGGRLRAYDDGDDESYYGGELDSAYVETDAYINPDIYTSRRRNRHRAAKDAVSNSSADFVRRHLAQNPDSIPDWEYPDGYASAKLASTRNGYVFPLVQNINGRLVDFTDPANGYDDPYLDAYYSALAHGDAVRFAHPEIAEWFAWNNYKRYFPALWGSYEEMRDMPGGLGDIRAIKRNIRHDRKAEKKKEDNRADESDNSGDRVQTENGL